MNPKQNNTKQRDLSPNNKQQQFEHSQKLKPLLD